MATDKLTLDEEMTSFINAEIASGRFSDPTAVVAAGLHALKMEEDIYNEKMSALRAAIREGDESGEAEGDVFAQIRAEIGLPERRR